MRRNTLNNCKIRNKSHHASNKSHHLRFDGGVGPPMTVWDDCARKVEVAKAQSLPWRKETQIWTETNCQPPFR